MENNKITQLALLIDQVSTERYQLRKSNDLKVKSVFDHHLNPFQEFEIQVSGESAYFKLIDEADGSLRELFSIYFYSRYKEDTRLELSYYTTNTQSEFELDRLIHLGKVARIIKTRSESILKEIADVKKLDQEREGQLFSIQDGYEKELRQIRSVQEQQRKVEIELSLRGNGVVFNSLKELTLKRDYFPRMIHLKITDVSKSGKTCTVVYTTKDGSLRREENCNVQRVIDQVLYLHKDIIEELLPQ